MGIHARYCGVGTSRENPHWRHALQVSRLMWLSTLQRLQVWKQSICGRVPLSIRYEEIVAA